MRKVHIDDLPRHIKGLNKGKVDWNQSVGHKVSFIYDDINGEIEIIAYESKNNNQYLTLRYNNKETVVATGNVQKGQIGVVLWKKTKEYRYDISTVIDNIKHGKLLLLDYSRIGKYNSKAYTYRCLVCGNVDTINESHLVKGHGCGVCYGTKVLKGYNDIHTINPKLGELLWNYDDGYLYTIQSGKKVNWKCQYCKEKVENKIISVVYRHGLSCPRCSDGISYPEKFMHNFIFQLGLVFEYQKTFEWSKNYKHNNEKLSGYKIYDFYIESIDTIIEIHGLHHYEEKSLRNLKHRTLKEEQENDELKISLAKENEIKFYIAINAKKSELEYVKKSIVNSKINELFDLRNIDWLKCHEYACNSLVKVACDLWNSGVKNVTEISKLINIHRFTVSRYLKQGAIIGLCDYDPTSHSNRMRKAFVESLKRKVVRLTLNDNYIDEFESVAEAGRKLSTSKSSISSACVGRYETAAGYRWMFKEDYDKYKAQLS